MAKIRYSSEGQNTRSSAAVPLRIHDLPTGQHDWPGAEALSRCTRREEAVSARNLARSLEEPRSITENMAVQRALGRS